MCLTGQIPEIKKIEIILDTDAKNEADDQFAIVHALLSPKFHVRGITASHFSQRRVPKSMMASYQECVKLAAMMNYPLKQVLKGNEKELKDSTQEQSDAVEFIIQSALASEKLLNLAVMGPLTNVAAAIMKNPAVADKIRVFYTGSRFIHTEGKVCMEANTRNDVEAFNLIMQTCPYLTMVPLESYNQLIVSIAEVRQKLAGKNPVGDYLVKQLIQVNEEGRSFCSGESWVLGDNSLIGIRLDPHCYHKHLTNRYLIDDQWKVHHFSETFIQAVNLNDRYIIEDLFAKIILMSSAEN